MSKWVNMVIIYDEGESGWKGKEKEKSTEVGEGELVRITWKAVKRREA